MGAFEKSHVKSETPFSPVVADEYRAFSAMIPVFVGTSQRLPGTLNLNASRRIPDRKRDHLRKPTFHEKEAMLFSTRLPIRSCITCGKNAR